MASSNIDISGLDYLNNTDYAMSSGLEDLNDEEKMNKLLAALAADEVPEIRVQPSSALPPNHPSLQRSPPSTTSATHRPHLMRGGESPPQGMFTPLSEAPGRDLNSRMTSGLEDFLNEPPSQAQSTEEEPELFGTALKALGKIFGGQPGEKGGGPTPWDVAAMGVGGPELWVVKQVLGQLFKNGNPSQKDGMFQDVEFKPWALDKFEDRMNEAPLLDRWAIQMKDQIGWQYMTPDERKDYIKNNKHDKNNHIIMHYNMYRRR